MSLIGGAKYIDNGGKNKIFINLFSISTILLFFLLFLSFLNRVVTVFELEKRWELVWKQCFFWKKLFLKISSKENLRFGHNSKTIALWTALIHVPDKKKEKKVDFYLSLHCFFDWLLSIIIFLSTLFHVSGN